MSRRRLCLEVLERRYTLTACANPSVAVSANSANEGETVTLNLSHSIDGDECMFNGYDVFFGDGNFEFTSSDTVGHVYVDDDPTSTASDPYQITVYGYWSDSSQATATTTITISNVPPQAEDDAMTVSEDDYTLIYVLDNDSDPSMTDAVHIVSYDDSMTTGLVVWDCISDEFRYLTNGAFDHLAMNETAIDQFMYTIADDDGGTSTATVTITIEGRREEHYVTLNVEGDAKEDGAVPAKLVIAIDPPAKQDGVVVHWTFAPEDGTEEDDTDHSSPSDWQSPWSGSVTFAKDEFRKEVMLVPVDDTKVELNEYNLIGPMANHPDNETDDYKLWFTYAGNTVV